MESKLLSSRFDVRVLRSIFYFDVVFARTRARHLESQKNSSEKCRIHNKTANSRRSPKEKVGDLALLLLVVEIMDWRSSLNYNLMIGQ